MNAKLTRIVPKPAPCTYTITLSLEWDEVLDLRNGLEFASSLVDSSQSELFERIIATINQGPTAVDEQA